MFFLGSRGVEFALPIKSDCGALVESFSCNSTCFFVSVFQEADGNPLIDICDFTPNRLKNWRRLIGSLHTETINYNVPSDLERRPEWNADRNYKQIKELCSDENIYNKFEIVESWLGTLSKEKSVYNLIHADIHHGNFFVGESDKISLFDFDDCCYHWFAYDLAVPMFTLSIAMRDKCDKAEIEKMLNHILNGYNETSTLSQEWIEMAIKLCSTHILSFEYKKIKQES
jgi:Ser/Thr protein kinase RdoA (MazF antagonist)